LRKGTVTYDSATICGCTRRNTRSFQHINRDESIAGTDAKAGDFENQKLTDLYKPVVRAGREILSETKLGEKAVYQFEIVAHTGS
jgi:hypothetical protein